MTSVIAIDTATDLCSVARVSGQESVHLSRVLPRAHNRHVLAMVEEALEGGPLSSVTHLVCGIGPGSFTGLRVAVATVQGLAWSLDLPVVGFCSLRAQALAAAREVDLHDGMVLSLIDAQIDQVYGCWYAVVSGQLSPQSIPWIAKPESLPEVDPVGPLVLAGNGSVYADRLALPRGEVQMVSQARPSALVMAQQVAADIHAVNWQLPATLSPQYVQLDVGWKKLSEQGSHV